ncbi:MAG: hypothetical protein ACLGH0_00845, partial [Thermoanaerobaculia bacterium]
MPVPDRYRSAFTSSTLKTIETHASRFRVTDPLFFRNAYTADVTENERRQFRPVLLANGDRFLSWRCGCQAWMQPYDLCRHLAMLVTNMADGEGALPAERYEQSVWRAIAFASFSDGREIAADAGDPREQLLRKYALTEQEQELLKRGSGSMRLQFEASAWYRWSKEMFVRTPQGARLEIRDGDVSLLCHSALRAESPDSGDPVASARNGMTLEVTVPPSRLWDVHFEADLAEELLKSVGYNATPITLPPVTMGALPSHAENVAERVNEVLAAEGFYEIFTDSFYGRGAREKLGISEGDPLWAHVEMQNSIERNYSLMRNNTIAQALEALATNVNNKLANVKMFEWARIYLADLTEKPILWALANGRDRGPFWGDKGRAADAIYLKGIVEQLRLELRIDLEIGSASEHR